MPPEIDEARALALERAVGRALDVRARAGVRFHEHFAAPTNAVT